MSSREQEWWEDVEKVISETDSLYSRVVARDPTKSKLAVTKSKIIEIREWGSCLNMIDKNWDRVIQQLGFFYVPKQMEPGPAFIFPLRHIDGKFSSAQTKPFEGSVLSSMKSKYRFIGEAPASPRWLGNDRVTLKQIIDLRKVMIVEGPFDILAAKLMCPDVPIMSPLTKLLGKGHIAYLRMLGVRDLFLMYDNEESKKAKVTQGAGNISMEQQAKFIKTMNVVPVMCPKSDPSNCLKNQQYAEKLRSRILAHF